MTTNPSRYDRRAFLQGLGLGAAFLPLLGTSRALAQPGKAPRRIIILVNSEGVIHSNFWPTPAGGQPSTVSASPLADRTLPSSTSPLEPYKSDLLFLDGLNLQNVLENGWPGHEAYSMMFTGTKNRQHVDCSFCSNKRAPYAGGITIDQVIANELAKTSPRPIKSLALEVQVSQWQNMNVFRRCFFTAPFEPVTPEGKPENALAHVFGAGARAGAPDAARLAAERKSMLDLVGRDLTAFSRRLGTDDKQRVEAHLEAVRELERQVGRVTEEAAAKCLAPELRAIPNLRASAAYPDIMNAHFDIATRALACDLTRVVTIQLKDGIASNPALVWLPDLPPNNATFACNECKGFRNPHDLSHNPGPGGRDKARLDRWYAQQVAGLIRRLKSVKEGDGTLFDNTVILYANHFGVGQYHDSVRCAWVLAGSCGGYFKTGRYINFKGAGTNLRTANKPVNGVMVALANAMGVPIKTFGDAEYGGEYEILRR
jgi:hypothetical protein